jgi:hypothetical protein
MNDATQHQIVFLTTRRDILTTTAPLCSTQEGSELLRNKNHAALKSIANGASGSSFKHGRKYL